MGLLENLEGVTSSPLPSAGILMKLMLVSGVGGGDFGGRWRENRGGGELGLGGSRVD